MSKYPETRAELAEAADAADFCLKLETARQFGLLTDAGEINITRCQAVLADAKLRGLFPIGDRFDHAFDAILDRERPRGRIGQPHHPA